MAGRDEIVRFCDDTLQSAAFRDYCPNGLQVVGSDSVEAIATAVSSSLDVFARAAAAGAQLLLVHHGLLWDGDSRVIGPLERRRLELLFAHDLSLVAYHLPLDAHPELGNNARLMQILGIGDHRALTEHGGHALGRYGTLPAPLSPEDLAATLAAALGVEPRRFPGGPARIRTVGVVSGDAGRDVRAAAALGLDAFVTGEPREDSMYLAEELGIHVLAAGHNATETVGVQALGEAVAARFGVTSTFLPVANPV